jgi:hypothetical protein
MQDDELIEGLARELALVRQRQFHMPLTGLDEYSPDGLALACEEATAALAYLRPKLMEEAARVADDAESPFDDHRQCQMCHGFNTASAQIAAAIRNGSRTND